jgi:hypothetical protein
MADRSTATMRPVAIPRSETRVRAERGSALLLGPAAVALCAVVLAGTVRIGVVTTRRARADAVADLTALAAVTGGQPSADAVARANGARVVAVRVDGSIATVLVDADGARARASAAPRGIPGG